MRLDDVRALAAKVADKREQGARVDEPLLHRNHGRGDPQPAEPLHQWTHGGADYGELKARTVKSLG